MEMEIQERAMKHVMEIGEERKRSSLKRRLMMRLRKDGYDASLCRSSWVATAEHPGGEVFVFFSLLLFKIFFFFFTYLVDTKFLMLFCPCSLISLLPFLWVYGSSVNI